MRLGSKVAIVTGTNITVDGGMTAILSHGHRADMSPEMKEKEREMREWLDTFLS